MENRDGGFMEYKEVGLREFLEVEVTKKQQLSKKFLSKYWKSRFVMSYFLELDNSKK